MKMKKKIIGLATATTLLFSGVAVGSSGYKLASTEQVQEKIEMNGGVIRLDRKRGVYLHTNSTHHSVGIEKVYIDKADGSLVVVRSKGGAVVSTVVTPDETLSEKGVTVGLSGGGKVSKVFFYKDGRRVKLHYPKEYKRVASATSNVWFMSITK
jgi:hypothetical protein